MSQWTDVFRKYGTQQFFGDQRSQIVTIRFDSLITLIIGNTFIFE